MLSYNSSLTALQNTVSDERYHPRQNFQFVKTMDQNVHTFSCSPSKCNSIQLLFAVRQLFYSNFIKPSIDFTFLYVPWSVRATEPKLKRTESMVL